MRVICVKNRHNGDTYTFSLTINKEYDATVVKDYSFSIINDNGYTQWCIKDWFIPIEEHRHKKLKELGI